MANVAFKKGLIDNINSVPIVEGQILFAYDEDEQGGSIYLDKDSSTRIKMDKEGVSTEYTLPTASASVLGGIKIGSNLNIDKNGVLSATDTNTKVTQELNSSDAGYLRPVLMGAYSFGSLNASSYTQNAAQTLTDSTYYTYGLAFSPANNGTLILGNHSAGMPLSAHIKSSTAPRYVLTRTSGDSTTTGWISLGKNGGLWFNSRGLAIAGLFYDLKANKGYFAPHADDNDLDGDEYSSDIDLGISSATTTIKRWNNIYASNNINTNGGNISTSGGNVYSTSGSVYSTSSWETNGVYMSTTAATNPSGVALRMGKSTTGNRGVYQLGSTSGWICYGDSDGNNHFPTTSDKRFKVAHGTTPMNDSLTLLKEIPVVNFVYKSETEESGNGPLLSGVYAQDVIKIIKENNLPGYGITLVAHKDENGSYNDCDYDIDMPEDEVKYSVEYNKFIPHLWNGWKYHENKIEEMEKTIAQLQDEIVVLKAQLLAI